MTQPSIKVGMIAEETGALSFMGRANANVARMVVDEINTNGGLLGRKIELYLEDGATTDAVAEAKAAKLVAQDKVDVIFGGIYSSTRQAIKGPAVVKGRTLYIYPEQYEGQECDPLIFPVPAQQLDPLIPWLMRRTGAMTEGFLRLELGGLCDRTTVKQGANSMAIKKDTTSQGYDCSTVIGLGCIAGAIVLLVTEVPALALLTMGIVEVPVPERGDNPEKRAERGEKLFATAIEAIE